MGVNAARFLQTSPSRAWGSVQTRLCPLLRRAGWPLFYAALVLVFAGLLARFYHPVYGFTSLFQLDAEEERVMLPELRERPVYVHRNTGSYDGMYYAQLAVSPSLRDPNLSAAMDDFNYRARRIFGSWIAWIAGLGNPNRALDAYALLNPFCWLVLAALLLLFFPPRSLHDAVAWSGLLFSAGVLGSVRLALTDLPALLLVAAALVAMQRSRPRMAVGWLAAASLARETSLMAAAALFGGKRRVFIARLVALVTPVLLWYFYVRSVAGPTSPGLGNVGWPGVAFVQRWWTLLGEFGDETFPLVPWFTLTTMAGLTTHLCWTLLRPNWTSPWWRVAAGYAVLLLCLGYAPWGGYPSAGARVLLPLHLAFNLLAPRTRAGLGLLILGNLSVFSGLDQFTNPPRDDRELAAVRVEEAAYLARTGEGWHGIERHGSRAWCWSGETAVLYLQAWHQPPDVGVRLSFVLKAFRPCTVTIQQGERVLWSGPLAGEPVPVELNLAALAPEGSALVFTSDRPGQRENNSAHARILTFSISDLRFSH